MKKEFYAWLSTVAEIEQPVPKKDPNIKQYDTDEYFEIEIDDEVVILNNRSNPTLQPKIKRLKPKTKMCELGCGELIADQVIEKRFCFSPERHWRTRCQNCGKYVNPSGGELVDGGHRIAVVYSKYFNSLRDK
jgi:hypothetical protein